MPNHIKIDSRIKKFNKKITVSGDKSLSIRWVLLASQAIGKSKAYNLLESEDIKSSLNSISKLGVKILKKKNYYEINGLGINNFNVKKNCVLNAGNSGTLARLILGIISGTNKKIKIKESLNL